MDVTNWDAIEKFVGYGRLDAPVVFVGMEEGQSDPANLTKDLLHRSRFDPVMDLRDAHRGIRGVERLFDAEQGKTQRTWRPMSHLMIRRKGLDAMPDVRSRLRYQALELGRANGDSLLVELLPYPKRTSKTWPEVYRERFISRVDYERGILPRRLDLLSGILAAHPRELIVCYGKSNWEKYKRLIEVAFSRVVFERPTLTDEASALTAKSGDCRIVLTTHFSCAQFNTAAQLEDFATHCLA